MFRPIPLFIGLRYTRAKRRNHFVSFISLVSMLGIALGIAVLITVLSVMNGFDYQIRHKIFDMADQVTVVGFSAPLTNWQSLANEIKKYPGVVDDAPYINGQGLLNNLGQSKPVFVKGISPSEELKVSQMESKMIKGSFSALAPGQFGIVMGKNLADSLSIEMGDKVTLVIPQSSMTRIGVMPHFQQFTVVGLYNVGGGFGLDTSVTYINLQDAQALYNFGTTVSGIRVKVKDLYIAPQVAEELQNGLQHKYLVTNWTEVYGDFFKNIHMQKTLMFFILVLIIAVAAFNLISSLIMIVTDKRPEIAILRTLGASPQTILLIFMVQGCAVGLVGTILGLIGGVALALYAPVLVSGIQHLFHVQFISSSVYLIDFLPSKLEWSDVFHVCLIALGLCLVATIYPAWRASRTQPAEALRYE